MSRKDYDALYETINAIPNEEVKTPDMPVDIFVQEAENLWKWAQEDKTNLKGAGLDLTLLQDLPKRAGACREAESNWFTTRFTRREAQQQWLEESPLAYDLRAELLHAMRYAYRDTPDLLERVRTIAEGSGHADMIQDLNDIAVLGKANPAQLQAIELDLKQLDKAATTAARMAELLAASTSEEEYSEAKRIRDKAHTYLKTAVDDVRTCGQYVFWRDPDRLIGYGSQYYRRRPTKPASTPAEDPVEPVIQD